ncbi:MULTISPECIES: M13 family metallopeptidase [Actinomycetaceae]|uniref:M13 family metallopeptidase n=1 Tax=Actinomycetaceae TaxID=2049 RepID=UPI00039813C1|nr:MULTISPECIES: M13-type metalloendopeptidase [Actinomycetaceae]ERH20948.1 peptidase family M13 [Actinomyces sp. oral taxon 172 str. F0311]WLD77286.1 M13-type metalloendopeptidase [Schaalia sp. HMT-172]
MTNSLLARVLETANMDRSVRPQDDFYRHVNGTWLATHEIPADRPMDGAFHALRDASEKYARAIAQDAAAGTLDDADASRIATLWTQFLDEDAIEEAGATPLRADLDVIEACDTREELAEAMGALMRAGIGGLVGAYVGTDPHDSSSYMVCLVQSGIGLPDEAYYREDDYEPIRQAYVAHTGRLLSLAGMPDPDGAARRIMALETALASHHRDSVSNRDPLLSDNPTLWSELNTLAPGFDWDAWARGAHMPVSGLVVNVDQPDYLRGAASLWERTDLATLKEWLSASAIDARASLLSTDFVTENFDFHGRTLAGTQELRPRWKRALSLIESYLGEAMGRAWVARHFPPEAKDAMDALVRRLLDAYGESIRGLDWMSDETKEKALAKLATFNPKIGYPAKWRDYSTLHLDPSATLVDNVRAANAHATDREWAKLGGPVDRDEWYMTPQTVNAYYNPTQNEIVFPAAILQPPFFDAQADDAVNFGAIGAVIGHEIGHGFDDQGSRYDGAGNLSNWWTDEDRAAFEERTHALIGQYDVLTPTVLASAASDEAGEDAGEDGAERSLPHVNGALTIGENIGDLGGMTIAWKAWVAALAEQGLTPQTAPVIDELTGPQRFFFSWARAWRTATRPQFARQMLAIDPHSPAEFRCNQVLRNLDAFAATFDVKPGDGMWLDPAQRVTIW